jgi:hypothetical protein
MVDVTKSHFGLLSTENSRLFSCLAFWRRKTADFFPAWSIGDGKWSTFFLLGLLATENGRLFSCLAFWRRKTADFFPAWSFGDGKMADFFPARPFGSGKRVEKLWANR